MKITLKSTSSTPLNVEIDESLTIDSLRLKLVEAKSVSPDYEVKLICNGKVLVLSKNISECPEIKEGCSIVFLQSKKKIGESTQIQQNIPPIVSNTQSQQNIQNMQNIQNIQNIPPQQNIPLQQNIPPIGPNTPLQQMQQQTALPQTFQGINVNSFRQFAMSIVMTRMFSDRELFNQTLLTDSRMAQLRQVNPHEFDNFINHPDFLGVRPPSVRLDNYNDNDNDDENQVDGDDNIPENLQMTISDKEAIEHIKTLVPHIDITEIAQYYIISGKNTEATIDLLLGNN